MILLSFLIGLAGFAAMGLSQPQHYGWALGRSLPAAQVSWLRYGGLAAILISLAPAMAGWGVAFGAVGWFGVISLAAGVLLLARTFVPARVRR